MAGTQAGTLSGAGQAAQAKAPGGEGLGSSVAACASGWVEVRLTDADGAPLAGEKYVLVDESGAEHQGKLDDEGVGRVEGLPAGGCQLRFPALEAGPADPDEPEHEPSAAIYAPGETKKISSGTRHTFRLDEWEMNALDATSDEDEPDPEPGATPPPEDEEWELEAYEPVADGDE